MHVLLHCISMWSLLQCHSLEGKTMTFMQNVQGAGRWIKNEAWRLWLLFLTFYNSKLGNIQWHFFIHFKLQVWRKVKSKPSWKTYLVLNKGIHGPRKKRSSWVWLKWFLIAVWQTLTHEYKFTITVEKYSQTTVKMYCLFGQFWLCFPQTIRFKGVGTSLYNL